LRLLYRAGLHGWTANKFHELCDDQGPTITVMKSEAGKVFGGFTNTSWESPASKKWGKPDCEAFIFSIDRLKVYPVINSASAVY